MLACGGCRVSLSCLAGRCKLWSFAASLISKWYTSQARTTLLLMHCQGVMTWLLQLSVLMTCRGQPVCCSAYVMLSSGPLVMSRMLSLKKHALQTACLSCVMVWYVMHCMVKKWHLWYLMTVTYILTCLRCIMTVLWLATWDCIACHGR